MLLRDLDDFDKWKKSMENKTKLERHIEKQSLHALRYGHVNPFPETNPRPALSYKDNEDSTPFSIGRSSVKNDVLFIHLTDGSIRLYYSAEAVNQIMEEYYTIIKTEKRKLDHWQDRCNDLQTAYNLQNKIVENVDKKVESLEEKIKILSEALTRSKMQERGKNILISRLKNQLNVKSSKRRSR